MSVIFFFHYGDSVQIKINAERRAWSEKGAFPEDGTVGTVVGYNHYEKFVLRWGRFGKKPGKYHGNSSALVRFEDGRIQYFDSTELELVDETLQAERQAAWSALAQDERSELYTGGFWVGDLPEYAFEQLDFVRLNNHRDRGDLLRVAGIEFNPKPKMIGGYTHFYTVEKVHPDGTTTYATGADESELRLVSRGNLWKHLNGEPTSFSSLEEEVAFHHGIGAVKDVANPATGLYKWTLEEALDAIQSGKAHGFTAERGGMIGYLIGRPDEVRQSVYRFDDEELGERVRQATLEGFNRAA